VGIGAGWCGRFSQLFTEGFLMNTNEQIAEPPLSGRLSDKNHLVYIADPTSSTGCRGLFVDDIKQPWWWGAGLVFLTSEGASARTKIMFEAHARKMVEGEQHGGPYRQRGTSVFLPNGAGGFDVRGCPDAEDLAARIVTRLLGHSALTGKLDTNL
jgi:hypothetical protein